jgi:proteasome assembly chaperone (PAC2) family protein
MADDSSAEITNPILGSLKVSGQNVNTIFTVFGFVVLVLLAIVTWNHQVEAKDADKSIISVLKENNKVVADALKDSNERTNKILEKMTEQQQRMIEGQREANCLLGIPPERRANSGEWCKRISR